MSVMVAYTDKGYRAYRTVNGIYRLYVGPTWATPKEAARYADALEATTDVSPLRREAHADPVSPLSGSGQSGFSPEPAKVGSGLSFEDSPPYIVRSAMPSTERRSGR